jgi:hypothetical protein
MQLKLLCKLITRAPTAFWREGCLPKTTETPTFAALGESVVLLNPCIKNIEILEYGEVVHTLNIPRGPKINP